MDVLDFRIWRPLVLAPVLLLPSVAVAKPIAFADGYTVMAEYGGGTMVEAQFFYAPRFNYSFGAGHLRLDSDIDAATRNVTIARINYLAKRWNRPAAQANVFVWGGAGGATGTTFPDSAFVGNVGAQVDYETRRVYFSVKSDWYGSRAFTHRIDTLQLGGAPYEHDYGTLATWIVVQARAYSGGLHRGTEWAALLRLFKGNAWLEAGVTDNGKLQAMAMFNF